MMNYQFGFEYYENGIVAIEVMKKIYRFIWNKINGLNRPRLLKEQDKSSIIQLEDSNSAYH